MIKDKAKFQKTNLKVVHKKKRFLIAGVVTVIVVVCVAIAGKKMSSAGSREVTYRETQVQSGPLTVGIEESGSVDIGTVDQTFELDLSAYVSSSSSSSSTSSGTAPTTPP